MSLFGDVMTYYVSERLGDDVLGDGSKEYPFRTLPRLFKILNTNDISQEIIYTDAPEKPGWIEYPEDILMRSYIGYRQSLNKAGNETPTVYASITDAVEIKEDGSLPDAIVSKVCDLKKLLGERVKVFGWAYKVRRQSKDVMYIILRDGTGIVHCLLIGDLARTLDALTLSTESSIYVKGVVNEVTDGQNIPGNVELKADYWECIGKAPAGGVEAYVTERSKMDWQGHHRHLMIRTTEVSNVIKLTAIITEAFRDHYKDRGFTEVHPPTLVAHQMHEDSPLANVDYAGNKSRLTQSSQAYLESCIPVLGNCYCIARSYNNSSFRSASRSGLEEHIQIEAESPFITFEDLFGQVEDLIVDVVERVMQKCGDLIMEMNPRFQVPKKPFARVEFNLAAEGRTFSSKQEAHLALNDGRFRRISSSVPSFIIHLPTEMDSFTSECVEDDPTVTQSFYLILPEEGGLVRGAMRVKNHSDLMERYKLAGIDASTCYWYTQLREFGTCPHGGYRVILERFCAWFMGKRNVREVPLYPRFEHQYRP